MPTVLITGASRGLGLEFAKQYAQDGWDVIATCRTPEQATALTQLAKAHGSLRVTALDVSDPASVAALGDRVGNGAIDLLLNNAGVFGDRAGFGSVDYDVWARTLATNTLAPLRLSETLVEHVARSEKKLIAHVTSKMGSIADNTSGGMYVYRSSKAALNMVNKSMAVDLAGRGITCVVLHPGWVATDMGGANAPLQPEPSVRGMRQVLAGLTPAKTGKFFNYDGEELPW
ncbi:MAG: SDR family oxidoreductase [Planctomycetota bacterium]